MLKQCNILSSFLLLCVSCNMLAQNGSWEFVGPKSNNNANGYEFETSRLEKLVIDPANSNHFFAAGNFAGLWESTNAGANWSVVNTNPTGFNGVGAIAFLSSTQLLVGNYHPGYHLSGIPYTSDRSSGVFIYNFQTSGWQSLGTLPAGGLNYTIKDVAVYPNNPSLLFVCTSIGVFRSVNGGTSWSLVSSTANTCVENMVFIAKNGGSSYYCYIAGSHQNGLYDFPTGKVLFMESTNDGQNFTDLSSNLTGISSSYVMSHAMLCLGQQTNPSGYRDLYLLTAATQDVWDTYSGKFFIHNLVKDIINTGSPISYTPFTTSGFDGMGGTRMALGYDPENSRVWFGGQRFCYYDLATSIPYTGIQYGTHSGRYGNIHDDIHDIKIMQDASNMPHYKMYVAHDAGLVQTSLDPSFSPSMPYFYTKNNQIDVCLTGGFSGSQQNPNLYALGGTDIINTDIYDAATQKNRYTHQTWENDGALIDKFNDLNMYIDQDNYNVNYQTSADGGFSLSGIKNFYWPASTSPFSQGSIYQDPGQGGTFTPRQFYQDPYRPNRIFHGKKIEGISQLEYVHNTFVIKIAPWRLQPNLGSNPSCTNQGDWGINPWAQVKGLSFSPQTINSLYLLVNDNGDNTCPSTPSVIKYIGSNIDDCWNNHNDAYNSSNPQWANITPNWANFASAVQNCGSCTNVTGNDLYNINFKEIETSPWNKDVVYVLLYVPNNPMAMILKYDGSVWSNYSTGLPSTEYPFSMIMDHASNDGIYLSSDMGVYYRDASMSSWIAYNGSGTGGLPIMYSRQMEVNYKENTVRAGTYGRGIFKSPLYCPSQTTLNLTTPIAANFYEANDITASKNVIMSSRPTVFRGTESVTLNPGFVAAATSTPNTYLLAFIHGCITGSSTSTFQFFRKKEQEEPFPNSKAKQKHEMNIYPNPNDGSMQLRYAIEEGQSGELMIFDMLGKKAAQYSLNEGENILTINEPGLKEGVYFYRIIINNEVVKSDKISIIK